MRRFLLSAFGLGFLPRLGVVPKMPGTWASAATAAAIVITWRATPSTVPTLVPPLVAIVLGSIVTLALSRPPGQTGDDIGDPGWIVTDEVAGQGVALVGSATIAGGALVPAVAAFVLFRVFDVWKPGPIRTAERLPGGLGILADDLVAGLAAGAIVAGAAALGAFGG